MSTRFFKVIRKTPLLSVFVPIFLMVSTAEASEACQCSPGVTVQKVGSVTVYRGPSVSYNYKAADQTRKRAEAARLAQKVKNQQIRAQKAQAAKIAALENKVDALEKRGSEARQPKRNLYGYGRSYYGNNRFFGRNGFAGNSNFSGGSVQLRGRNRGHQRRKGQHHRRYKPTAG